MKRKHIVIILVLLLVLSAIALCYPFMEGILYEINPDAFKLHTVSVPTTRGTSSEQTPNVTYAHGTYTLVIPKIGVNATIGMGGNGFTALDSGVWYYPSSTPNTSGQVDILGHRFEYLPPSNITFYLLDRLQSGDSVILYWKDTEYIYQVYKSVTIPANDEITYLNAKTSTRDVVLVTCTPLWSATDRMLVYARQMSEFAAG